MATLRTARKRQILSESRKRLLLLRFVRYKRDGLKQIKQAIDKVKEGQTLDF